MFTRSVAVKERFPSHARTGPGGTVRLSSMHKGEAGCIELLDTGDGGLVQRLVALGVLPGANVRLLQRVPAFVVQVDNTQIAMDETMAGRVQVRLNAA